MIFRDKVGTAIELITQKMRMKNGTKRRKLARDVKHKNGILKSSDLNRIYMGLDILERLTDNQIAFEQSKLLSGDADVSKIKRELIGYSSILEDLIRRLKYGARDEAEIRQRIESLLPKTKIVQAARDGIILKQETRREEINGEVIDKVYDTAMTPNEVISILFDYERELSIVQRRKIEDYMSLGLGMAGILGMLFDSRKSESKGRGKAVAIGTVAITGINLIEQMFPDNSRDEAWNIRKKTFRMRDDLLENESVSSEAVSAEIDAIAKLTEQEQKISNAGENRELIFKICKDILVAIIIGAYVNKTVKVNESGKLEGKALASTLIKIQSAKGISEKLVQFISSINGSKAKGLELKNLTCQVQSILRQMEEKVDPLIGAEKSFDSLKIIDLDGKFYPKRDYETGKILFSTRLVVPEFSMKRGDVVLLSGESGSGKSTFLRLLKRGDINNRNCIILDDTETVDNLGSEYISFRPSIDLGNETNVLFQITGKESISELDDTEKESVIRILHELKLDFPDLLEQLASKKFMEFSTGQQRRLALSKLFYRIDDGTSVIIVDEPVGNVENELIRSQLEMIKAYAERKNVMLLLTTHRLDLVQDLVTKRYHINQEGVLENIPVKTNEEKGKDNER